MVPADNRRILVIDDEPSIHGDFQRILSPRESHTDFASLEERLFGIRPAPEPARFSLTHAHQGREGADVLRAALDRGEPFFMAFVDMRMPPGWDGLRTIEELWKIDPRLQIVVCTAYSDHAWEEVVHQLDTRDRLLITKKPFDPIEVSQAAVTLCKKWGLERESESRIEWLQHSVEQLTRTIHELKGARGLGA